MFVHAQHANNAKHVYKGRTRRDKKYDVKNDVLKYCIHYTISSSNSSIKKNVFHYLDLTCVQRVLIEHTIPGRKIPCFRGCGEVGHNVKPRNWPTKRNKINEQTRKNLMYIMVFVYKSEYTCLNIMYTKRRFACSRKSCRRTYIYIYEPRGRAGGSKTVPI